MVVLKDNLLRRERARDGNVSVSTGLLSIERSRQTIISLLDNNLTINLLCCCAVRCFIFLCSCSGIFFRVIVAINHKSKPPIMHNRTILEPNRNFNYWSRGNYKMFSGVILFFCSLPIAFSKPQQTIHNSSLSHLLL